MPTMPSENKCANPKGMGNRRKNNQPTRQASAKIQTAYTGGIAEDSGMAKQEDKTSQTHKFK